MAAEAAALAREDAATELRLVMAATQVDLPRMIRAVEVADETGVDRAAIAAAQQTLAKAQRRAAAKEELAAALLPSVEELSNQETLLLRLRAAAAEAEEVGLPSLSAAQQKMVAAEKARRTPRPAPRAAPPSLAHPPWTSARALRRRPPRRPSPSASIVAPRPRPSPSSSASTSPRHSRPGLGRRWWRSARSWRGTRRAGGWRRSGCGAKRRSN